MMYNKKRMISLKTGEENEIDQDKNLSIKKKILLGYLLIICITLMVMFLLLGTLWKHLIKESISKSIYSSNYQIKKSIDNYLTAW